jgi:Rrf2 family iron-sulfur cluster assembly transcriptional regulator
MPSSGRCITHDLWEGLSHHIQLYLGSVSLGDVISGRLAGRETFDTGRKAPAIAAD